MRVTPQLRIARLVLLLLTASCSVHTTGPPRGPERLQSCDDSPGGLRDLRVLRTYVTLEGARPMGDGHVAIELRELIPLPSDSIGAWRQARVTTLSFVTDADLAAPSVLASSARYGVRSRGELSATRPRRWLALPTVHGGRSYLARPFSERVTAAIADAARLEMRLLPGTSLGQLHCTDDGADWPDVQQKLRYPVELERRRNDGVQIAGALEFEFDAEALFREGHVRDAARTTVDDVEAQGTALLTLGQERRGDGEVEAELQLHIFLGSLEVRRRLALHGQVVREGDRVFVLWLEAPDRQVVDRSHRCVARAAVMERDGLTMRLCAAVEIGGSANPD